MPQYVLQRITLNHLLYKEVRLKTCRVCGKEKELEEFIIRTDHGGKRDNRCKECTAKYKEEWARKNAERLSAKRKADKAALTDEQRDALRQTKHEEYVRHKDWYTVHNTEYYQKHREAILLSSKQYRDSHSEWKHEYDTNYYRTHKEQFRAYSRYHRKTFPEKHKMWRRRSYLAIRADPNRKIKITLRTRIQKVLKGQRKYEKTMKLVGCSIPELRQHLESQFLPGMNWENHGVFGWHVDHIKPCSSFDLTDPEQQKLCFHYTNLQPLWALDNIKKGDFWQGARVYQYKRKN